MRIKAELIRLFVLKTTYKYVYVVLRAKKRHISVFYTFKVLTYYIHIKTPQMTN